jgi:dipeptidyl aminopeptidase/acylaminoacyl peptidase
MKQLRNWLVLAVLISSTVAGATRAQQSQPPGPRMVDLKSTDGTLLKATYFSAGKPGPGVLLFHQANRTRTSWDGVARQLAAAGINTVAVDGRGHGESGGTREDAIKKTPADMEIFFQFLISQPGVQRDVIGLAGAGSYGPISVTALHAAGSLDTTKPDPAPTVSCAPGTS